MTVPQMTVALACVMAISSGQVLFKMIGVALANGNAFLSARVVAYSAGAVALYASATLAWVWLLRNVSLTKAYPFMALSFVLVPAASVLAFNEPISIRYIFGVSLIIIGLIIITG